VADIGGIGIGCTGPVDSLTGRVHNPYTLPTWDDLPLVDYLRPHFDIPIYLLGDCDVAALGEYWCGAGRGYRHMLYITVGTGIGGGIIHNGRLHRGVGLVAIEPGHHVIDLNGPQCYCGARGCLEMFAAAPAIARRGQEAVQHASADSLLLKLAEGDPNQITPKLIAQAAEKGDPAATEVMRQTGVYLGVGLANLINILTPEVVVMGGGVMQSWNLLAPQIKKTLAERGAMVPFDKVKLTQASLGLTAGVIGAGRAILDYLQGTL
jgi:glucokinase